LRLPIVGIAAKMSPRAIPPKVIVGPIADHQVVIVPKPAITLSIAPNNVANARAARATPINASVARIVAIYKLAAFFVVMPVIITIATACVSPNTGRAITVDAIGPIAIAIATTLAMSMTLGQRR
jgi:hypothetical protein